MPDCSLKEGKEVSYKDMIESVNAKMDAVALPSTHPHYILYTSGTTGMPKVSAHFGG